MPFDSQGNFTRVHNWEDDRINDIEIVTDHHDEEDDNFATGLSQTFLRDGRATMTGNLNLGNFQIKNVADATLSTDAVNKKQLDAQQKTLDTSLSDFESQMDITLAQALKRTMLSDCILEAPNGVATYTGNTITVKSGLKVLIPDGRHSDGTLKSIEYKLTQDVIVAMTTASDLHLLVYSNGVCNVAHHQGECTSAPKSRCTYDHYYNPIENVLYESSAAGTWFKVSAAIVAKNITSPGSAISSFKPYKPARILLEKDQGAIVDWATPDYAAGISIASGFVAPVTGWIYSKAYGVDQCINKFYINGIEVFEVYREHMDTAPVTIFIGKGDTLTYSGGTITPVFYPCKGAY